MMRFILITLFLLIPTFALAEKTLQCERYTVKENEPFKQDRTVFTFSFSPDKKSVIYEKISGPDWFLPSKAKLTAIWISKDNLRIVAYWLDDQYEKNDTVWTPAYLLDLDFKKPRYKMESYGGFADFDELLYSPWKQECMRID